MKGKANPDVARPLAAEIVGLTTGLEVPDAVMGIAVALVTYARSVEVPDGNLRALLDHLLRQVPPLRPVVRS